MWTLLLWVSVIVWVLTIGFLAAALLRSRRNAPASSEPALNRGVGLATAVTVAILLGLVIASAVTGSGLSRYGLQDPLNIMVTGNQWWWQVDYESPQPNLTLTTANEIHVPVGRPVVLKTTSRDVIHSFWVPNLSGKIDSIPNHVNTVWFRADKAGVFRGQCAEFCGLQHAHMALLVIAEPPEKFYAWLNKQREPARAAATATEIRGRDVFLSAPCVLCHSIRGTGASGQVAPDLTHIGSRQTIAAGTLPNTPGNLGGWITDSQRIKPGNHMPPMNLKSDDVQPLLNYLESLQ
jgi:cytochrome c oxidase subunit 2